MDAKDFEGYGLLEYLEEVDYFSGDWSPVESAIDENGEEWDIVYSKRNLEYRYACI